LKEVRPEARQNLSRPASPVSSFSRQPVLALSEPVKGLAHSPACVPTSLAEREGIRGAPSDRLSRHTPPCSRFRGRPVMFPLRHVGPKSCCTPVFRTEVSRARYFNPQTGRFWTADTYEGVPSSPQSLHKYVYCQDSPVVNTDPSGHDIGEALGALDMLGSFISLRSPSVATAGRAAGVGGTCGPDVTDALMNTTLDVEHAFMPPSRGVMVAANAEVRMLTSPLEMKRDGWDIGPLNELGQQGAPKFGNGSLLGTGSGKLTVQFRYMGQPAKAYYASSMNYVLWGKMFRMFYEMLRNPVTGIPNPMYSEEAAVEIVRIRKAGMSLLGTSNADYNREAAAFVRLGYSGTDPSSTALPVASNPSNVGASTRFPWKWIGIHDYVQ
jgi:hypothetical protein